MKITGQAVLKDFRGPGYCERCGQWCRYREAHHLFCRGLGGGNTLNIRINLVALGYAFACACHVKFHAGKVTRQELIEIVAKREGKTVEWIVNEIYRIRREPKQSRKAAKVEAFTPRVFPAYRPPIYT